MAKVISEESWNEVPAQGQPGDDFPLTGIKVLGSWDKEGEDEEDAN